MHLLPSDKITIHETAKIKHFDPFLFSFISNPFPPDSVVKGSELTKKKEVEDKEHYVSSKNSFSMLLLLTMSFDGHEVRFASN